MRLCLHLGRVVALSSCSTGVPGSHKAIHRLPLTGLPAPQGEGLWGLMCTGPRDKGGFSDPQGQLALRPTLASGTGSLSLLPFLLLRCDLPDDSEECGAAQAWPPLLDHLPTLPHRSR